MSRTATDVQAKGSPWAKFDVPSRGSTSQVSSALVAAPEPSSASTAWSGKRPAMTWPIVSCAARSTEVTIEVRSFL